ncbi:MAG: pyridoxamine 5'-phosphate oxidase family protein [Treponema sp.]|nr:pyridoxamine 5'-phosphate oxidase family protein [Treponema sp.]
MRYEMRRKDRAVSRDEALAALDKAAWGILSTVDGDGAPYGVPLSLVREGEWLYFHCAPEGHKIDNLRARPEVCVSFVGDARFPEDNFTVAYESAVVFGRASEVTGREEKIHGLRLICERFTPKNMSAFDGEIAAMLDRTGVWKIHLDEISGKQRKWP